MEYILVQNGAKVKFLTVINNLSSKPFSLYFDPILWYACAMNGCRLCPVACGADRKLSVGACGGDDKIRIGYAGAHFGEEPPISLGKGSGAIFFSGCPLRCVFCQNAPISVRGGGKVYSESELESLLLELNFSCENINLVTAGHQLDLILPVLERVKPRLTVPVVYNSGGYETVQAIARLSGIADVFLPDYKYFSSALAKKYSARADYPSVAVAAIDKMVELQPKVEMIKTPHGDKIVRGVIVRHLVLPGCRHDSEKVIDDIARRWKGKVLISLMSQYTPEFNRSDYHELDRRVTTFEYESVLRLAAELGLDGYMQSRSSATSLLTPSFLFEKRKEAKKS